MKNRSRFSFSTTHMILVSFLIAILVGTLLLFLPISSADGMSIGFVNALLTATSATCVTGLVAVPTFSSFSIFGQAVILFLIQIGGLGIITVMAAIAFFVKKEMGLSDRVLLQDSFNLNTLFGLSEFIKKVVVCTLAVEGIGALLYMTVFVPDFGARGIWVSVFTSVSAFCNAGIDIIAADSLCSYYANPLVNIVTCALIILGGIGYIVWWDVMRVVKEAKRKRRIFASLTLHSQELAVDLGTANTLIIHNGKVVVDEPSIIAVDIHTGKVIAIGKEAQKMHGKTHQDIKTIRPLKDGVIADFNAAEQMLRGMIKKVKTNGHLFSPSLKMVVCIPSGSTNVEIRTVRESAEHAGARDVYMIFEPMAAALGAGLDVEAPEGSMILDIGGGTTEIACISLGGIVCSESIDVAGDVFTEDIQKYIRQQYNVRIGERTAENIKMSVGAALRELDNPPEDFVVTGPNMLTSLPTTLNISYSEIAYALEKSLLKVDAAVMKVLEMIPPELYSDIMKNGIYLAGGGALIKGLDKRLQEKTDIPFIIAEDPLRAIVRGTSVALKNINNFSFLMK